MFTALMLENPFARKKNGAANEKFVWKRSEGDGESSFRSTEALTNLPNMKSMCCVSSKRTKNTEHKRIVSRKSLRMTKKSTRKLCLLFGSKKRLM